MTYQFADLTNANQKKIVANYQQELRNLVDFYSSVKQYSGYKYNGWNLSADTANLSHLSSSFVLAIQNPNSQFVVRTVDNQFITVTSSDLIGLYIDINGFYNSILTWQQSQYQEIADATGLDALKAIQNSLNQQDLGDQTEIYLAKHATSTPRLYKLLA